MRGKFSATVGAACVAATLIAVPSAQAAITMSNVTSPANGTYALYNTNKPNTISIVGTSNGTTGNHVDLVCYAGDTSTNLASNVAVGSNGSFSVSAASLEPAYYYRVCQLKAVPAGTTPGNLAPYTGPRLYVGDTDKYFVSGGPNNGRFYAWYLYFQQPDGGHDYNDLGDCGIDNGYLLNPDDSLASTTWYCDAWLTNQDLITSPTRSETQVDGANAYPPAGAKEINANAAPGFPRISSYSYSQSPHTGDAVIRETEPFVKCPNATYPPTSGTCPSFVSTGVTDARTFTQDDLGKVTWITDVFKSTNGKAHTVDLLWQNDQRFYGGSGGSATQVEYEFPGQSGYSMHQLGDTVKLPAEPGTILVRYHGAPDGAAHGRGAIVYNHPATAAKFIEVVSGQSDFTLHQTIKVPAHGSITLRWAYINDFEQKTVDSIAKHAAVVVQGCTVPNVAGKSLAAAKKAIKKAHCTVGKVSHAHSAKTPAGDVVSQSPKARTNVDYGTNVRLKVSSGP